MRAQAEGIGELRALADHFNSMAERIQGLMRQVIANEKEKAMDDAKYQIADLAILAAAKVIKKNVGGDSDRETVDEFLSEVGAAK